MVLILYPKLKLILPIRYLCYVLLAGLLCACQNSATPTANNASQITTTDAHQVDRLLELIDQRLALATQVAKSKWNTNSAVDDPKREAQILKNISAQASSMGIQNSECNLTLMKKFFQNQFDAGKIIQKNWWVQWRNAYPAGYQFKDAPNLARDVRPALDQLTPELITAFCNTQPTLSHPGVRSYLSLKANSVIRGDANGTARHQALKVFEGD